MKTRVFLSIVAVLVVAACDASTAPLKYPALVSVPASSVGATLATTPSGATVTLEITAQIENRTAYTIYVSPCETQLYRKGATPVLVAEQGCTATEPDLSLAPGEVITQTFQLRGCASGDCVLPSWSGVIDGRYRLLVSVDVAEPGIDPLNSYALSRTFEVRLVGNPGL